jgi:nucleotide-binding universal stress UspA family protein
MQSRGIVIKNILYPTDLNPCGAHVLSYVLDLAESLGSRITVLHVIDPLSLKDDPDIHSRPLDWDVFWRELREKVTDTLVADMECCNKSTLDLLQNIRVEYGDVVDVILQASSQQQSDLIVMGSSSFSEEHRLLGSVIRQVLMASRVPAVVVPMPDLSGLYAVENVLARPLSAG